MVITSMNTDVLWEQVKILNEKSHIYSECADILTKLINELEDNHDR